MDREKVIKGLELCEIGSDYRCYETECPYYGQGCTENLKNDILALLKEQEAVVRCEDCAWWGTDRMCENSDSPCFQNGCTHGNWFCADGERMEVK